MSDELVKVNEDVSKAEVARAITDNQPGFLDIWIQKLTSRKLFVFFVATALLFFGKLNSAQWATVSSIYIGGTALIQAIGAFKNGGDGSV